jgi:hypothetical protein
LPAKRAIHALRSQKMALGEYIGRPDKTVA